MPRPRESGLGALSRVVESINDQCGVDPFHCHVLFRSLSLDVSYVMYRFII